MHKLLREAKCLKAFSDVHEHIRNAVSPYQKRLLLTGQDSIKNFLLSRSTTFHTHTSSCFSQLHFSQLQTQNQNRNILLSLLLPHSLPPPNTVSSNPHPSPICPGCTNRGIKLYTSCRAPKWRHSLTPSHFTSHQPCRCWLWTWKYKCRHWLNFCIPTGFKWYAIKDLPGEGRSFCPE